MPRLQRERKPAVRSSIFSSLVVASDEMTTITVNNLPGRLVKAALTSAGTPDSMKPGWRHRPAY
jgi:hypothetical protein